jgi:hypothetical protein
MRFESRLPDGIVIRQGIPADVVFMSFYRKYELKRMVAEGEATTFQAVDRDSGRELLLHIINPGGEFLLKALRTSFVDGRGNPVAPLIEAGEFAGTPYAVTEILAPFSSLKDWLRAAVSEAAQEAGDRRGSAEATPGKPDEKTKPVAAVDAGPGEFTRLFGAGKPVAPLERPVTGDGQSEPRKPASDDFDDLFGAMAGESIDSMDIEHEHAKAVAVKTEQTKPFQPPGDFTRCFGLAAEAHAGDEVGRGKRLPHLDTTGLEILDEPHGPLLLPKDAEYDHGPSDYTRIIGGLEPSEIGERLETSGPQAPVQPAPQKPKSTIGVAALACAGVLLAIWLVVYLAVRH